MCAPVFPVLVTTGKASRFTFGGAGLPDIRWLGRADACLKASKFKIGATLTFGVCIGGEDEFFLYDTGNNPTPGQ